jgi:hypothetical protein
LTLTAVAVTGLSFIIARRQHLREKAEAHMSVPGAATTATKSAEAQPSESATERKEEENND